MKHAPKRLLAAIVAVVSLGVTAPVAVAGEQATVQRGGSLLDSVQSGKSQCSSLSTSDFEAIGEFVMQRMVGSVQAHESMDQAMTRMMGSGGLEATHRFLGQRFSGCARGPLPRGFAGVMGMMGMMGGSNFGPGMKGQGFGAPGGVPSSGSPGGAGNRYVPGTGAGNGYVPGMMGRGGSPVYGNGPGMMNRGLNPAGDGDNGWSPAATVAAIAFAVLLLLLVAATIVYARRGGPGSARSAGGAAAILDRRLATGEIDRDEYEQRRAALGGGKSGGS